MTSDTSAQSLHGKATRGGTLTEAEQAALEAWYQRQDAAEMAQFAASSPATSSLESLRLEVSAALKRLNETTQQIQAQSDENERLRQGNLALSRRLIS